LNFHAYLSATWRLKITGTLFVLKQPVYRAEIQFIRLARKNSAWTDIIFGYEYEDHRLADEETHYLTLGIPI
jgi:hypothetical protein